MRFRWGIECTLDLIMSLCISELYRYNTNSSVWMFFFFDLSICIWFSHQSRIPENHVNTNHMCFDFTRLLTLRYIYRWDKTMSYHQHGLALHDTLIYARAYQRRLHLKNIKLRVYSLISVLRAIQLKLLRRSKRTRVCMSGPEIAAAVLGNDL